MEYLMTSRSRSRSAWFFVATIAIGVATGCGSTAHLGEFDYAADVSSRSEPLCPAHVEDIEGNSYRTVLLGDQCWFADNLRVTKYRDGQPIGDEQHDTNDLELYGRLYPWVVVANSAGLCPAGFEVPTDEDFKTFEKSLGMSAEALAETGWRGSGFDSRRIKAFDIDDDWTDEQRAIVNATGFAALPSGLSVGWLAGGAGTYWESWTRSSFDEENAWGRTLHWSSYRDSNRRIFREATPKSRFYAVRCVKTIATE